MTSHPLQHNPHDERHSLNGLFRLQQSKTMIALAKERGLPSLFFSSGARVVIEVSSEATRPESTVNTNHSREHHHA